MRFADWYAAYLVHRDEVAKHEKGPARDTAIAGFYRHCAIAERLYHLAPDVDVNVTYQLRIGAGRRADATRSAVLDIRRNGHSVSMSHYLTPSDLFAIAEILETSDAWEAGLRDEMPPTGRWPGQGLATLRDNVKAAYESLVRCDQHSCGDVCCAAEVSAALVHLKATLA